MGNVRVVVSGRWLVTSHTNDAHFTSLVKTIFYNIMS